MKNSLSTLIVALPLIALTACETTQQKPYEVTDQQQAPEQTQELTGKSNLSPQEENSSAEKNYVMERNSDEGNDLNAEHSSIATLTPHSINDFYTSTEEQTDVETSSISVFENENIESSTTPLAPLPSASSVNFGFDQSELTPEDILTLLPHVEYLIEHPTAELMIEGHTDTYGPAEYNLYLSEKRAKTVKTEMVSLGVSETQLIIKSHGEGKPVSQATANRDHRRVELNYTEHTQQLAAASETENNAEVPQPSSDQIDVSSTDAAMDSTVIATGLSLGDEIEDSK